LILLVGANLQLFAQLKGKPFISHFSSKNYGYHNQNWSVVQDNRGLLFFGNNSGLMYFNGNNWDLVEDPRILCVRSIAKNNLGRLLCGSVSEFGYIEANTNGKLTYVSLSEKYAKQLGDFSDVWSTLNIDNYTYFCTPEGVFKFQDLKLVKIYRPSNNENTFHKFFLLGNHFIAREKNKGLFLETKDGLKFISGSEVFEDEKVDLILPFKSNSILIGTRTKGLYICNELTQNPSFKKLSIENSKQLVGKEIYCGIQLHDGSYAIGTFLDGIYFLNKELEIVDHLTKQKGLNDNKVTYLFEDANNILWATLDKGIAMIEYFSPFEKFDESYDLEGNINSCIQSNDDLYISTTKGLYHLNIKTQEKFELLSHEESYNFLKITNSPNILCATRKGILILSGNRIIGTVPGTENSENSTMLQIPGKPNLIVVAGLNNVSLLENKSGKISISHTYDKTIGKVRSLVYSETDNAVLWGIEEEGIFKLKLDSLQDNLERVNYGSAPKASSFYLFKLDNKILATASTGIIEYSPTLKSFKASNILEYPFKNDHCNDAYTAKTDADKWIWLQFIHNNKTTTAYTSQKTEYTYIEKYFGLLNKIQVNDFFFNGNYTWLSTNEGLFRYKKIKADSVKKQFTAIITKVKYKDKNLFFGNFFKKINGSIYLANRQTAETIFTLPYNNNSIAIDYSSNTFRNFDEILYQTYLENYEENFGEWTKDHKKSYTNLAGGKYVFHVRAKDADEKVSEETTFTFYIEYPWYEKGWGITTIVLFTIAFLGSVTYLYTRYKTKRIEAEKKVLEAKVAERTHELEISNQEVITQKNYLEIKNVEIDHKNKEITQSIEYALHIQQSILPDKSAIYQSLKDSFVLYKPKDIVSGDFFAFTTVPSEKSGTEEFIIAAADCTGHGVPGALMSMLGSNILYQIINEKKITQPSDILYHLNLGVNESLKQNTNEGNDGMDIVLCKIRMNENADAAEVNYSGANRPLYIIRNGELEEIKATKMPIGGVQNQERIYNNHSILLNKGDVIYLTTDGYADQFGGELGKKLTTKKFKEFITSLHHMKMLEQGKLVDEFFENWRGNNEQIDDVCIIGIRI
jgi:serine phosphatase RsbU (regulator of sigma subunit)/ligand-binding sensor domain-containing protein